MTQPSLIVDRADPRLAPAFALICAGIPDPEERDSWEEFQHYAGPPDGDEKASLLAVVEEEGTICAAVVGMLLVHSGLGMLVYVVVSPDAQGRGLGGSVVRWLDTQFVALCMARGITYRGCLAETNRPETDDLVELDGMPVLHRLHRFTRMGFGRIDFDYVQPALTDTGRAVGYLMLIYRSPGREPLPSSIPADILASALHEFLNWVDDLRLGTGRWIKRGMLAALATQTHVLILPLSDRAIGSHPPH